MTAKRAVGHLRRLINTVESQPDPRGALIHHAADITWAALSAESELAKSPDQFVKKLVAKLDAEWAMNQQVGTVWDNYTLDVAMLALDAYPYPDLPLPPTDYLVMEVLAARARLGEAFWTFPNRFRPVFIRLMHLDLAYMWPGVVERTLRGQLTHTGEQLFLSSTYQVPHV